MNARLLVTACALSLLAACASVPKGGAAAGGSAAAATAVPAPVTRGTVQSIREVKQPGRLSALLGTVGGAAICGVAGANIGGGTGKIVASSVLSVITGSVGSTVAGMFGKPKTRYEVVVRHDDGIDRTYTMDTVPGIKPGSVVGVDAKGALSAIAGS